MNEPKVAYRNKLLLFWLLTSLGISYSTAYRFTFKPGAPPKKIGGPRFAVSIPGRRKPQLRHCADQQGDDQEGNAPSTACSNFLPVKNTAMQSLAVLRRVLQPEAIFWT